MAANANGKQSNADSIMEAITNTVVGYIIAFVANHVVLSAWYHASMNDTFWITNIFTVISLARQYTLRRIFNGRTVWEEIKLLWRRAFKRTKFTLYPSALENGEARPDGTFKIKLAPPIGDNIPFARGPDGKAYSYARDGGISGQQAAPPPLAGDTVVKAKTPRREGRKKMNLAGLSDEFIAGRFAFLHNVTKNPHGETGKDSEQWDAGWRSMAKVAAGFPAGTRCHGDRDGECSWDQCPQIRDMESHMTGRHCPLDRHDEDE